MMSDESAAFYKLSATKWNGDKIDFSAFEGFVLLIINVASKCKLAPKNYENFAMLLERYYDKGLRILLFPCNQYLSQEPEDINKIHDKVFDYLKGDNNEKDLNNNNERFELFDKVDVYGDNKHEVFNHLTKTKNGKGIFNLNFIKWNFEKFLVDRSGKVVKRISPYNTIDVDDKYLLNCINNTN
ncbi:glutathione peroxidase [Ordospora colligata]|uniref:Glutathione peroxidase n=1 Tax=Ordospora colligata OC4 TaxID=1354746 RepID=A0A0B2ULK6_9MICR|nr:glutathione peroxidase [Ordospora colligata OC4]KHN70213.1 glutathione peroxidase [Ordospora colligata OC4]TBU16757.1 glutathione peroxidase [Ordospora colligata]TBU17063.1 glutathione peroxidase [Ordospora colligata]TBU19306.1 glutathione peroxidase [Ordospora colligata]